MQHAVMGLCAMALLHACSGGGGGGNSTPELDSPLRIITGIAQKGPFQHILVTATPASGGEDVVYEGPGQEFVLEVQWGEQYSLSASGVYTDERSGEAVTLSDPIRAVLTSAEEGAEEGAADPQARVHINVLTELVHQLHDAGTELAAARQSVDQWFSLEGQDPATLDIADLDSIANQSLLAFSVALLDTAESSDQSVQELIAGLVDANAISEAALQALQWSQGAALQERLNIAGVIVAEAPIFTPDFFVNTPAQPVVSMDAVEVFEHARQAGILLQWDEPLAVDATITATPQASTAQAATDFDATPLDILIPAGHRRAVVNIPLVHDEIDEAREIFFVHFSSESLQFRHSQTRVAIVDSMDDLTIRGELVSTEDLCLLDNWRRDALPSCRQEVDLPISDGAALARLLWNAPTCDEPCSPSAPVAMLLYGNFKGGEARPIRLVEAQLPRDGLSHSLDIAVSPDQQWVLEAINAREASFLVAQHLSDQDSPSTRSDVKWWLPVPTLTDTKVAGETPTIEQASYQSRNECSSGIGFIVQAQLSGELEGLALESAPARSDCVRQLSADSSGAIVAQTPGWTIAEHVVAHPLGALQLEQLRLSASGLSAAAVQVPLPDFHWLDQRPEALWGERENVLRLPNATLNQGVVSAQHTLTRPMRLHTDGLPVGRDITAVSLIGDELVLQSSAATAPEYATDDPRSITPPAGNHTLLSRLPAAQWAIRAEGVHSTGEMSAGSATTSVPQAALQWQGGQYTVSDGQLQALTLRTAQGRLSVPTHCQEAECGPGAATTEHRFSAPQIALQPGLGWLGAVTLDSGVAFGAQADSSPAFERNADREGHVFVLAPQLEDPVAALDTGVYNNARSRSADGSYPGITVGSLEFGAIDAWTLNNQDTTAHIAHDAVTAASSPYSKYVLNHRGLSGTFNHALSAPIPTSLYGFETTLERFDFQVLDNRILAAPRVDAQLRVEGDLNASIPLQQLAFNCAGEIGPMQLDTARCTSDDCRYALSSWQSTAQIQGLHFESPAQCAATAQRALVLEHDLPLAALNQPMQWRSRWNSGGDFLDAERIDQAPLQLDGSDSDQGFVLHQPSATLRVDSRAAAPRPGDVLLQAELGLPFWQMAPVVASVTNISPGVAAKSAVLNQTATLEAGFDREQLVLRQADTERAEPDQDIAIRYAWGNTGFSLGSHGYYQPPQRRGETARLLGRQHGVDLIALQASGRVVEVTPTRTSMRFGASAELDALDQVQIDFTNPEHLSDIDQILVQAGVIDQPIIAPTLGQITRARQRLSAMQGMDIDPFLRRAIDESLVRVAAAAKPLVPNHQDPFVAASNVLAVLHSLPEKSDALLQREVADRVDNAFEQLEQELRERVLEWLTILDTLSADSDAALFAALEPVRTQARQLRQRVSDVEQIYRRILLKVVVRLTEVQQLGDDLQQHAETVSAGVDQIDAALRNVADLRQCGDDWSVVEAVEAGEIAMQLRQGLQQLQILQEAFEGSRVLLELLEQLGSEAQSQVGATQGLGQDLAARSAEIALEIQRVIDTVKNALCSSDVEQVLDQTQQYLARLRALVSKTEQAATSVTQALGNAITRFASANDSVLQSITDISDFLARVEQWRPTPTQDLAAALQDDLQTQLRAITHQPTLVLVASPEQPFDLAQWLLQPMRHRVESLIGTVRSELKAELSALINNASIPAYRSPEALRADLANLLLRSPPIDALRQAWSEEVGPVVAELQGLLLDYGDALSLGIRERLAEASEEVNQALDEAVADLKENIPVTAASMDGRAEIMGSQLERLHLAASWTMRADNADADSQEAGRSFNASLDATRWSASGKASCGGPDGASNLDVLISTRNLPMRIGDDELNLARLSLGFTLSGQGGVPVPIGINGAMVTEGVLNFTEAKIFDPALMVGIGKVENYLGARAAAMFSDVNLEAAVLIGKACFSTDPDGNLLLELDPQAGEFITIPETGFSGAYVRGAASFPIYSNGCPLTVGVGADVGAWLLVGQRGAPTVLGGIIGGGAFGKVGCVGALRGQITLAGQADTSGAFSFDGEGFGVAGLGDCEPASWTSVTRSRQDSWCGTADASFGVRFKEQWDMRGPSLSAIH